MAVFGVPQAHEDDALRAVRAAVELRAAVATIGLRARIGVNTGEVVAGEGDALVTGDAVNVAARLEQNAEPGEILIGQETQQLVRDAVQVEPVELELKGKSAPVAAYRLLDIDSASAGLVRRLDSPIVGRERELQRLRDDFDNVVSQRSSYLFTLLGRRGRRKVAARRGVHPARPRIAHGSCAATASTTARESPTGRSSRCCSSWAPTPKPCSRCRPRTRPPSRRGSCSRPRPRSGRSSSSGTTSSGRSRRSST